MHKQLKNCLLHYLLDRELINMKFLKNLISECIAEVLSEEQLDKNMQTEADVTFYDPKTFRPVKFKYNFLSARDKDINKVVDIIKKKYPYIKDVDLGLNDELELMRQFKQNGTLTNLNNKLYLYADMRDGDIVLKATKNKNLASRRNLPLKNAGK